MQTLIALAVLLTALVFTVAAPSSASAYTQDQQAACQDDAFRFCGDAIPDENRVRACLVANLRRLSPACRRLFNRRRPR
jgi:hypothetical protein